MADGNGHRPAAVPPAPGRDLIAPPPNSELWGNVAYAALIVGILGLLLLIVFLA